MMDDKNIMIPCFQTFFVSREQSNCPILPEMIKLGKNLKEKGLLKDTKGIISLGYGRRVLINSNNLDIGNIKKEDILEVVDYDPAKKNLLVIGQNEPNIETPVHWIVISARNDVNAIVQLNNEKLAEKFEKKLPTTEKEQPPGTLELAKEVLKTLRKGKNIVIKNKAIFFVGASFKEIEESIIKIFEENKHEN
ncbi:MAG: class II aldolase/adducin family protein [Candidatus Thermoplasmatota archaeon]|jgi:ribulose-5-phosphate 4-epimerase/fuculose-1-phosphate aldolase|nr:class II aldolase/adducin family protein [Candidatus Thermoplasmatota archaeon]